MKRLKKKKLSQAVWKNQFKENNGSKLESHKNKLKIYEHSV